MAHMISASTCQSSRSEGHPAQPRRETRLQMVLGVPVTSSTYK